MELASDRIYIAVQLALGKDGRERAFDRICRVFGREIYFYISTVLPRHGGHIDDCYQEAMLRAYNGLERFTPGRPVRPWLYRVAHNCCVDFLKSDRDEPLEEVPALPVSRDSGPEEELVRRELADAIDASIALLPADEARIVYLRLYGGMKFREIADVLCMNESTVKTRFAAARRRLRDDLKEWL